MIQIIHMVLKNKLIKNISLPPLYLPHMSPTDFYHPDIEDSPWKYQCGKCTAAMDMSWGYGRKNYIAAFIITYFLNRTTVDMPCPVMDGAYFIRVFSCTLV